MLIKFSLLINFWKKSNYIYIYILTLFSKIFFHAPIPILDLAKHFSMVQFLCQFQQVDVNLGPGYKNLTLNCQFLPFKPDTHPTLVISFCKIFIPNYVFDALLCWNWPFLPPSRLTLWITLLRLGSFKF
jgi:hypothetical protein